MNPIAIPESTALPRVTVAIPCYQQEAFLADAISSIKAQDYPDCEIIVVDDGSTEDLTGTLQLFPDVKLIRQVNSGVAIARNKGLNAASGKYIKFLDADDQLLPGALAAEVRYLEAHPACAFVSGQVRLIDEQGADKETPSQPVVSQDHFRVLLQWNYIWTPGAVLYRRSVFETVPHFDPTAGRSEDYDLNVRIAYRYPVGCLNRVVLAYRQHGTNITSNYSYMLRSGLGVRKRFYSLVKKDPGLREAWKTGIRSLQADLGRKVWDQLWKRGKQGRFDQLFFNNLICLISYATRPLMKAMMNGATGLLQIRTFKHTKPKPHHGN